MLKKEVCPGISLLILSRRFSLYSVLSQTPHGPADGFRATISWTPADRRRRLWPSQHSRAPCRRRSIRGDFRPFLLLVLRINRDHQAGMPGASRFGALGIHRLVRETRSESSYTPHGRHQTSGPLLPKLRPSRAEQHSASSTGWTTNVQSPQCQASQDSHEPGRKNLRAVPTRRVALETRHCDTQNPTAIEPSERNQTAHHLWERLRTGGPGSRPLQPHRTSATEQPVPPS